MGVAPQNMYLLSSLKPHTQFHWNLTTTFTPVMYQRLFTYLKKKKIGVEWCLRGVAPQNMYLLSSPKLHTQFQWNLTTTFITRDVPKFDHGIKKIGVEGDLWGEGGDGLPPKIGICYNIGSLVHFADSVPCWLPPQYQYSTRWVPRGIAAMFTVSSDSTRVRTTDVRYMIQRWRSNHYTTKCGENNFSPPSQSLHKKLCTCWSI